MPPPGLVKSMQVSMWYAGFILHEKGKREKGRKGNSERGRNGYVKGDGDGGRKEYANGMGKGNGEGQENVGVRKEK